MFYKCTQDVSYTSRRCKSGKEIAQYGVCFWLGGRSEERDRAEYPRRFSFTSKHLSLPALNANLCEGGKEGRERIIIH